MRTRRALPNRRHVLASIAAVGEESRWPDHPVRIIVPYPAGGSTDVLTRVLGERLKDILGQPFVIENRAGASGNLGIAAVTGRPTRRLHHRFRDDRPFRHQSVSLQQDAFRP